MLRGRARCLACAIAIVTLAAGGTSAAAPVSTLMPPTTVVFRSIITPRKLPTRRAAPVSLALSERIGNRDGSHPPALQELKLDLDRHLGLSVKGLPTCPGPLNESGPRTRSPAICADSKIGSGTMEVEVAFPELQPVRIKGLVTVYNGGFNEGRTKFWVYTYLPAPVTGAILVPFEVRRDLQGIYGWEGLVRVPKIANGAGSITTCASGSMRASSRLAARRGRLR